MTARANGAVITGDEAVAAASAMSRLLPASLAPAFGPSFIRSHHLYDEFVARLALRVFRTAGLADVAQHPGTTTEIAERAHLDLAHAATPVDWLVRRLAARGLLEDLPGLPRRFRAPRVLPDLDPAPMRDEQAREDASWLPSYVLAETVAADYSVFLRGERSGEEILFSPGRLKLWVEFFSNENGLYAINNLVGAIAAASWAPPGPLLILELGAGLGSAAIALLDALREAGRLPDIAEYRFTDVVPGFLRRGHAAVEKRFPDATFVSAATIDMNRPLAEQGIEPGRATLVYAVNTLHVAKDLAFTLGQIRDALVPGGVLAISECVRPVPGQAVYAEFVFNLLESFRSPVLHPAYRPNGGFLTPDQWRAGMREAGFADVRALPDVDRLRDAFPDFFVTAIGATRR